MNTFDPKLVTIDEVISIITIIITYNNDGEFENRSYVTRQERLLIMCKDHKDLLGQAIQKIFSEPDKWSHIERKLSSI